MTLRCSALLALLSVLALPNGVAGQTGGFVATLGADTVHVERFSRTRDRLEGTIVTHVPRTRIVKYSLTFAPNGAPLRYDVATTEGDGTPLRTGGAGSLTYTGDSVIRETTREGQVSTQRISASLGAYPTPSIPYFGVSYLMYEYAFADARRRANGATDEAVYLLTMIPGQMTPGRTPIRLVGSDSAEMSYFGVAWSGYKFDAKGQLLRSDWTGTTYRYRIARVANVDVEAIARAWTAADQRGASMGALSPRDTTRATVAGADLLVDYSRPSKRGRKVWGEVVPWEKVWRLGADFATHFVTSRDLRIGETDVPAGTYTIWMLPSERGETFLIINKQTRIFGTNYNSANDLARIPLRRSPTPSPVERLTIAIEAQALSIRWDDAAWSVPIVVR